MATAMETAAAPHAATGPTAPALSAADKLDAVVGAAEQEHRKAIAEASREYRRYVRLAVDGGELSNEDASRLVVLMERLELNSKAFRADVATLTRALANEKKFEFDDEKFVQQQRENAAKHLELRDDLEELIQATASARQALHHHSCKSSGNSIGRAQAVEELKQHPRLFAGERGGLLPPSLVGVDASTSNLSKQRKSS